VAALRQRSIAPIFAPRRSPHGSGLGKTRWPIERTLSWLHQFRRLRVRYDRRADIHEAFLTLGCALICWRTYLRGFC
jgi:transposase